MKYYFTLQQSRLERHLSEIGLHPIIGYLLGIVAFILFSIFLFYKTVWAEYIYSFIALTFIVRFSATPRNDFLKLCFPGKGYYRLRILENTLSALPFSAYLLYEGRYLTALLLLIIATLLSRVEMENKINVIIPTPFYQYPFEFIIGFRQYFLFMFLPYFLAFKAYEADNFNLGAFALGLMFLFSMAFYLKPENEYFVWIYSKKTTGFLIGKVINALICASFLTMPILLALCAWKTDQIGVLIGIQGYGYVLLTTMVLAKYSAYPFEMNVPQAILLALSLWFPPMLLVVIPLFYYRSKRSLNPILG